MAIALSNGGVNASAGNGASASTSITVVAPAGIAVGDWAVAMIFTNHDISTSHDAPTGGSAGAWTNVVPFTDIAAAGENGAISVWIKQFAAGDVGATFTFTSVGDTGRTNAMMVGYTGLDATNPFSAAASVATNVNTQGPITYTGLTPSVDDCMVLAIGFATGELSVTLGEPTVAGTATTEHAQISGGSSAGAYCIGQFAGRLLVGGSGVPIADATGTIDGSIAATNDWFGTMVVLNPPGGGGGPTTETLEPDSVVGTPTGLIPSSGTNDAAGRLAALVATGGPYMAGTDPSGSSGSVGPVYPNARVGATGQTAFVWGSAPANVIDTSDTTSSTEASSSSALSDYFSFAAGAFSGVPAGATITGVSVAIKHNAGTTNRVTPFLQLGTANGTLIGSEVNAVDNTVGGTTKLGTAAVTHTVTAFGAVPTLAQLQTSGAAGFGVRLRITRSSASTYVLFSIKVTVTYTTAGSTTPTDVRVTLQNPVDSLVTGAGTGVIHALLRKLGSGTNPTATIHIRRAGSNTDVGASSAITLSSASFTDQTYTFDQSILSGDGNDVEIFVNSAGAAGGLMEVDHIYWVAQTTPAAPSAAPVHRRLISRAALVRSNRY